jgi:ribonuclease J
LRIKIHRGTAEIGGTCIELATSGGRLLLDLGLPLDGDPEDLSCHPDIEGLNGGSDLLGLVLSHGHMDHWGLALLAGPNLPVYLGGATHRILKAAAPFVPRPYVPPNAKEFQSGVSFEIGPFKIAPHLVDHSAYDAHAIEIEAEGQRLFYSGDIRGHGRKAALFERLIANPPRDVDIMFMEGSSLGRLEVEKTFPSEAELEAEFVAHFSQAKGLVLVAASAQNIDRIVSIYRACKRTGRTFLIDVYAAEILRATDNPHIPQSNWPNIALYVPQYQRVQIKRHELFSLLDIHKSQRVFAEDLARLAPNAVMLFRRAMFDDLERANCLEGAQAIWSQWDGYLKKPPGEEFLSTLAEHNIPLSQIHTSGHASIRDLKRLAKAIAPKALVPIHTFEAGRFPEYFDNVVLRQDGQWWEAT